MQRFRDRRDAGARLGRSLTDRGTYEDAIVLGLPRGGVPVAYEIARAISRRPIDAVLVVLVVRVVDDDEDFTQTTDDETRVLLRSEVEHGIPYPGDHPYRDAAPRRPH